MHVGGRTQFDGVWIANTVNLDGAGGALGNDAVDFRRARLRIDGTMYEFIDWAVEFDFVNSVNDNIGLEPANKINVIHLPAPTDLWFDFAQTPIFVPRAAELVMAREPPSCWARARMDTSP